MREKENTQDENVEEKACPLGTGFFFSPEGRRNPTDSLDPFVRKLKG
ncbi:hypothetical protein GC56T3_0586 [Geobacillus sp. C56-T3]|nr:hypothetical protein GC56T3_0586 [Geobacillus sp. C56-T3]ADU95381.1 hypothetical protein GYMC52_3019 [Geobacillus sp. Y412MC52]